MLESRVTRRNLLKLAALSVGAVALGACTQERVVEVEKVVTATPAPVTAEPTATPVPQPKATDIRVLVVGDPFQYALEKIKDDFKDETGITVNLESLAYDTLNARLMTSMVSGQPDADVISYDQIWIGQYTDNGWMVTLDDYIKGDSDVDLEDFIPEVVYAFNAWRGHMMGLPIAAYAQGVMYHEDVWAELGLPAVPADMNADAGWTWEKYLEIIKQINGKKIGGTDFYGTVVCGAQPAPIVHMYTQLAASFGTRWFKSFPEAPWDFTPTINSPENLAALKFYVELYKNSPPEAINYVWFDAGTRFGKGDIGMFFWWTPYFYLAKSDGYMTGVPANAAEKIKYGVLPRIADGAPQPVSMGGWSYGIPRSSNKVEEAWQFIKWATSAKVQKKMGLVPDYLYQFADFTRKSLYQDPELKEIYPYLDIQYQLMLNSNGKIVRAPAPIYTSLEGVYGLKLNQVLAGALTPEDALKETETLWTNLLQGNLLYPEYKGESFNDTLDATKEMMAKLAKG